MNPFSTAKTLFHMAMMPLRSRNCSHEQRLEQFYKGQAGDYDAFRKKLLHGRREMIQSLPVQEGDTWVDFGAGTGENVEMMGERLATLQQVTLVDLCESLLEVAGARIEGKEWKNVQAVHADATTYTPPEPVDIVTFSYSLTMIPDWFLAIDNALRILKPGGVIGVVDFYVSRTHPDESFKRHRWFTRMFWPTWFNTDNVWPNKDHLPYLCRHFVDNDVTESKGKMPLMPLMRVPHYRFVGRKPAEET